MLRRTFIAILSPLAAAAAAFGQSHIDAGTIKTQTSRLNVPVYSVAITSPDANMAALAKRAFNLHGSYKITPASRAQFVFDFAPHGANAVKLTITKGASHEQVCSAPTTLKALMKACDAAVMRTLRSPGFFAGTIAFSYSPDNWKTSEICVSDMVFQNVRSITRDKSDSLMPHFSPDGKRIIYTGYFRTGFMDLYLVDLAANTRKVFASYKGSNTGGSFSRDGSKVAVVLTSSGNAEVWTANSSGGGFKKITNTKATESSPCFSPDGSKIVFASDTMGGPQIYTISSSGGKMQRVNTRMSGYCSEPAWNPYDANKIAFTAAVGKGFQVAVYDFSTRSSKWVTSGENTSGAVWLNDGRHLICTKSVGDTRKLFVVDTETNSQKPLHTSSFNAKEADFVYAPRM